MILFQVIFQIDRELNGKTGDRDSLGYPDTEKRVGRTTILLMKFKVFDISYQSKQKLRSKRRSEIIKTYANLDWVSKRFLCLTWWIINELVKVTPVFSPTIFCNKTHLACSAISWVVEKSDIWGSNSLPQGCLPRLSSAKDWGILNQGRLPKCRNMSEWKIKIIVEIQAEKLDSIRQTKKKYDNLDSTQASNIFGRKEGLLVVFTAVK